MEGIGIGLNITKVILKNLGGDIEIDSKGRNRGSTVTVNLPSPSRG